MVAAVNESTFIPAGALVLSPAACAALVDALADPGRRAALSPAGGQAASAILAVGRAWANSIAGSGKNGPTERQEPSSLASDDLLDVAAVAARLNIPARTVRWIAENGRLRGTKLAGRWTFEASDVDNYRQRDTR